MRIDEAAGLIAGAHVDGTTWADLGCGEGTFTLALATLLPHGSTIHAIDRDRSAVKSIPAAHGAAAIVTHVGDFSRLPWPFDGLDGVLMANSLHYLADPLSWLRACEGALARRRFLIVEYDTDQANPWVPYPLNRAALSRLFHAAGYRQLDVVGVRPSRYRRAPLYAAMAEG